MGLSDLAGNAEIIGGGVAFLLLVYRQAKTGTRDGWRDAAESHRERADALELQVGTLVEEVKLLRVENGKLRVEVAELRIENRDLRAHIDTLIGGDG